MDGTEAKRHLVAIGHPAADEAMRMALHHRMHAVKYSTVQYTVQQLSDENPSHVCQPVALQRCLSDRLTSAKR